MPLLLILQLTYQTYAETDKVSKIEKLVSYFHNHGMFNGTILVAEHGKIIYNKAFGYANFETNEELETMTPFNLASVSKQFTAMAIMILQEQNKLSYDDTLSEYFSEFPEYANQITIRHLLTHSSGIKEYIKRGVHTPKITNQIILDTLTKQNNLDFIPGEQYKYSNSGYVLLSIIVEKVSGMKLNQFLQTFIFKPLHMQHTYVHDDSKPVIPNRATGHNMYCEDIDYPVYETGSSGIYSSTEDLFKWDQALYTEKLVKNETLEEAFQPYRLKNDSLSNYGFGWMINDFGWMKKEENDNKVVWHDGYTRTGFLTYFERQTNRKNTIIILTNKGWATPESLIFLIKDILNNKSFELPKVFISIKMNRLINHKGLVHAIEQYKLLKKDNYNQYDFSQWQLNDLGYHLMRKNKFQEAIEVLKLNVEAFPDEFDTYDSLAEAYMKNSEFDLSIKNYKKSLELNPENKNAVEMLKEIDEIIKNK
jgi:CubicO group peptidase (beta-lactamase class C family)